MIEEKNLEEIEQSINNNFEIVNLLFEIKVKSRKNWNTFEKIKESN